MSSTALAIPTKLSNDLAALKPGSPEFEEKLRQGACELAALFDATVAGLREHWKAIDALTKGLDAVFVPLAAEHGYSGRNFKIDPYYEGKYYYEFRDKSAMDQVIKQMNTRVWALLIDKLGVKNLMSVAKREAFEKQIANDDVPEVTAEHIFSVITGLTEKFEAFAIEAAQEALGFLTPGNRDYKTNSGFRVGKRVVLAYYCAAKWDGSKAFEISYHYQKHITAIEGTFRILDGKGPIKGKQAELIVAVAKSPDGRGETEYFKFRCCKNRNLHLEFKNLELVKKLNGLATGQFILGEDP